jgi:endoglucanase
VARGRGISLGGALDGERPAGWLDAWVFDVIRAAGFDLVRVPVRWPAPFEVVDRAVGYALERELDVVLDVHHYHELSADPDRHAPDFLALWERIAEHYAAADPKLCFELLNEPHDPLTAERWNELLAEALAVVRASNPTRTVVAGPVRWNIVEALPTLRLPDDDHLVATAHYYSPFRFTHQGAAWLPEAGPWLGTGWGSDADRAQVRADLEGAAAWAREREVPLLLGEFGVVEHADMAARAAWTALVRSEAERLGMRWAYWDFATDFGAYDLDRSRWRAPLAEALLGA